MLHPRSPIPSLTGIRFVAASLILFNHLLIDFIKPDSSLHHPALHRAGTLGMDVFFVLSGFIIHHTYSDRLQILSKAHLTEFVCSRLARLYPLYIVALVVDAVLSRSLREIGVKDVWHALPFYISGTSSWFYVHASNGQLVAQMLPRASLAWSISTEFFLYLTYPLIAPIIVRKWATKTAIFACCFALSIFHSHLISYLMVDRVASGGDPNFSVWLGFISPYTRISQFLLGALICELLRAKGDFRGGLLLSIFAAGYLAAWLFCYERFDAYSKATFDFLGNDLALGCLFAGLAIAPHSPLSRLLSWQPIVKLGEASYSLYLLQLFVLSATVYAIGADEPVAPKIAFYWIALILVSLASFNYFEKPAKKWVWQRLVG